MFKLGKGIHGGTNAQEENLQSTPAMALAAGPLPNEDGTIGVP